MDDGLDARYRPLLRFMEEGIPFNAVLGIRCTAFSEGRVVLTIPWRDELIGDPFRPAIHGGVISALVDVAGGAACFSLMRDVQDRLSTVDLRVDYLRPGPPRQDLWCEARVLRMGNRVAATRMEVFAGPAMPAEGSAERDRPIAIAQGVYNLRRRHGAP